MNTSGDMGSVAVAGPLGGFHYGSDGRMHPAGAAVQRAPVKESSMQSVAVVIRVDWTSLAESSNAFLKALYDYEMETALLRVFSASNPAAPVSGKEIDGDGALGMQMLSVLRSAVASAIRRLEAAVHPRYLSPQRGDDSPDGGSDSQEVVCPICAAVAAGHDALLARWILCSSHPGRHAAISCRQALLNPTCRPRRSLTVQLLWHTFLDSVRSREQQGAPVTTIETLRDMFLITQMNVMSPHWAAWDEDAMAGDERVRREVDTLVAASLSILLEGIADDDDSRYASIVMMLNAPVAPGTATSVSTRLGAALGNGATIVHVAVACGLHATLRWLLGTFEACTARLFHRRSGAVRRRLVAIRCDALNREGGGRSLPPLAIAVMKHDVIASRLLLLHGASAGFTLHHHNQVLCTAGSSVHGAERVCLEDTVGLGDVFHAVAQWENPVYVDDWKNELQRLFSAPPLPVSASLLAEQSNVSLTYAMPLMEWPEDIVTGSLQGSMERALCRTNVGRLLCGIAERLASQLAALPSSTGMELTEPITQRMGMLDAVTKAALAALHADPHRAPIVADVLRSSFQVVRQAMLRRSGPVVDRPLEVLGLAELTIQKAMVRLLQQVSASCWQPSPQQTQSFSRSASSQKAPPSSSAQQPVEGFDTASSTAAEKKWEVVVDASGLVSHVKVYIPSQWEGAVPFRDADSLIGDGGSGGWLTVWLNLWKLDAAPPESPPGGEHSHREGWRLEDLAVCRSGVGFVGSITAAACTVLQGDCISFQRKGRVFLALNVRRDGSVLLDESLKNTLGVTTLRKVSVGAWTIPEHPSYGAATMIHSDPLAWFEPTSRDAGGDGTLLSTLSSNPQAIKRLHAATGMWCHPTFWAEDLHRSAAASVINRQPGFASFVAGELPPTVRICRCVFLCERGVFPASQFHTEPARGALFPWEWPETFCVVDTRRNVLLALIPSLS